MIKFPPIFINELSEKLTVVYTGGSVKPTPWFSAVSIEAMFGVKNPYGSSSNRVNTVVGRITKYLDAHPEAKHLATGTTMMLLGSVKPAEIVADDGTYAILGVKSSRNATAKASYYYNEAALFYVLTTSKTDVGNDIQHWVNGIVLPSIARTGEYIAHRKDGIGLRRGLTDAIKMAITNNETTDKAYMSITDAVYYIRFGLHTQTLREYLKLKDGENIREHLNQEDLDALAKLEDNIAGCINLGVPLDKILASERWIKLYRRNLI